MGEELSHNPKYEASESYISPRFTVRRISEGLGFGSGSITSAEGDTHDPKVLDEAIENSPDIITPVQTLDDGCSDGRVTIKIFDRLKEHFINLNRPKIFGGAVTMNSAIKIGLGCVEGKTLQGVFNESMWS